MSSVRLSVTIFIVVLLSACSKISLQPGQELPRVELYSMEGQMELLEFYRGNPIKILFWTHKCSHSVRSLKRFEKSRPNEILMTVSIDDINDKAIVEELLKHSTGSRNYFSGNGLYDPAWNAVGGLAVPATLYISSDLRLLRVE